MRNGGNDIFNSDGFEVRVICSFISNFLENIFKVKVLGFGQSVNLCTMICKGDVFLWFNNLNGASRIDVIHGLLNKCVPWELRFLGSCLEDMCKSSYEHLKKWEYIANSATELGKLDSISENPMRSTVIISLALLHSSNRTCANITFNLLATQINVLLSLMANPSVADEIALLFTLALRHPAFTFEQKRTLEMHLKAMEETYGQNILNVSFF